MRPARVAPGVKLWHCQASSATYAAGDERRGNVLKTSVDTPRSGFKGAHGLFLTLGVFSMFVNLLMLTGPIYMLQVYDRVLASRSVATLVALTVLIAGLYALMGVLDYARGRVVARDGRALVTAE